MRQIRLKKWLSCVVGAAMLLTAPLVQAQSFNPKDKGQMRQLAYDSCMKSQNAKVCGCFADRLQSELNDKEWGIFIAEYSQSAKPPADISAAELDNYGRKLAAAGNACGM